MNNPVFYNYSYSVCALVIVFLSYYVLVTRKDMRRKNSKLFMAVLIVNTIAIITDIVCCIMDSNPAGYSVLVRTTVQCTFMISHLSMSPLITWYFINFTGMNHNMGKVIRVLFVLPFLFLTVLPVLIGPIRQNVFYYDASGAFTLGPYYFFTVPMGGLVYCIVIAYVAYKNFHRLSREQKNAIVFLIIFCSVPTFVQNIWVPTERFNIFFETVGIFMVLITLDNQNWVYHNATQTYNRLTMQRHLQGDLDNKVSFGVLLITIDRTTYFRAATMSNEEFQRLMASIGNYMKGLHGRLNIYYCERGTFAIPVYKDSPWKADDLEKELQRRFESTWTVFEEEEEGEKEIKIPIRLTFVRIPENVKTLDELFNIADFPYDAETDEPLVVSAETMKIAVDQFDQVILSDDNDDGSEENIEELPEELSEMMDDFTSHIVELTQMERKVLLYYINGYEIADLPDLLGVTINTVRKHNRSIYKKLRIGSKAELMIYLDILDRCGRLEPIEESLGEDCGEEIK
ncbi:MAG: helix-turn-helix transcriptional regulator [Anaerovoracaceae bacterium]